MKFESEVVSEEILPAIRKLVAESLHKDYGHTQEEIAATMEVTQPAVSQYLKGKRADKDLVETLSSDPQIQILIEDAVSKAARNKSFVSEISEIIQTGRDKGIFGERLREAERVL